MTVLQTEIRYIKIPDNARRIRIRTTRRGMFRWRKNDHVRASEHHPCRNTDRSYQVTRFRFTRKISYDRRRRRRRRPLFDFLDVHENKWWTSVVTREIFGRVKFLNLHSR